MASIKIGRRDLEIRELVLDDGPAFGEALAALTLAIEEPSAPTAMVSAVGNRMADLLLLFVGHHEGVDRAWLGKNLPLHHARLRALLDACLETLGMVAVVPAATPGEAASP